MTKNHLVAEAVRTCLEIRHQEVPANILRRLAGLDRSVESSVSPLTGLPPERIKELGGVGMDD